VHKAVSPKSLVESNRKTPAAVALLKRMDPPRHAFTFQPDRLGEICWNAERTPE
jgi:hypothetical protein